MKHRLQRLLLLTLLGVGGYLVMSNQATTTPPVVTQPTITPTVTMSPDEQEINALDTGETSTDAADLEEDIESLSTTTTPSSPSATR